MQALRRIGKSPDKRLRSLWGATQRSHAKGNVVDRAIRHPDGCVDEFAFPGLSVTAGLPHLNAAPHERPMPVQS
jgi:hypothetical protein